MKKQNKKKKHLPGFVSNGPIAAPAKPNPNCPHNLCFPYSFLSCNSFKTAESSNGRTGAFKAAVTVTNTTRAKKELYFTKSSRLITEEIKVNMRTSLCLDVESANEPHKGATRKVTAGVIAPK